MKKFKDIEYFGRFLTIFNGQIMFSLSKHINLVVSRHLSHPLFFKTYTWSGGSCLDPGDYEDMKLSSINFLFFELVFVD